MRKINKRKITILIILMAAIIIEIIAFGLSRGNDTKSISVTVVDSDGLIKNASISLVAIDDGASGYYVTLPNLVSSRFINNYLIEEQPIQTGDVTNTVNSNEITINTVDSNETNNAISTNENTTDTNTITESTNVTIVQEMPGDKLYLTETELGSSSLTLNAAYDKKETDGQILYNKELKKLDGSNTITVTGYMPDDAVIDISGTVDKSAVEQAAKDTIDAAAVMNQAYNIKLMANDAEYTCSDFNETLQVSMYINDTKKYILVEVNNDGTLNNITDYQIKSSSITFNADALGIYAVLEIPPVKANIGISPTSSPIGIMPTGAPIGIMATGAALVPNAGSAWDGTTATAFAGGDGTAAKPYFISNGSELAYLSSKVDSGTTYDGIYFQVTNNIDLNGNPWNPIGDYTHPFQGVFDGAGHTIANAVITIQVANAALASYGIFGSIGGSAGATARAVIQNVEFNNITININITANGAQSISGANNGFDIGFVAGTMYRRSTIKNCIVNNSSVNRTGSGNGFINITTAANFHMGGIAGIARETSTTIADPGAGARYEIDNCYVSANMGTTTTPITIQAAGADFAEISSGGIIGKIRNQPVWPTNCLFQGAINTNASPTVATDGGCIGPIFGSMQGDSVFADPKNGAATDDIIFSGNDKVGGVTYTLNCTSYFTNYTVKGIKTFNNTNANSVTGATPLDAAHRIAITTNTMARFQGVNKGTYTTDMNSQNSTSMLNMFNTNVATGVTWTYDGTTFHLKERLTEDISADLNLPTSTYSVVVHDNYNIGNYTCSWYITDIVLNTTELDDTTGLTKDINSLYANDRSVYIETFDGQFYTISKFTIAKLDIAISFDMVVDTLTASIVGTAVSYINLADYTYTWYETDFLGEETVIADNNSLVLTGTIPENDYRLVVTNTSTGQELVEATYQSGTGKKTVQLEFSMNNTTLTAALTGDGAPYINMGSYTCTWYDQDDNIVGGNSLVLTGADPTGEYTLVITNNRTGGILIEDTYTSGIKTVIYVSSAANATYGYPIRK